MLIKRILGESVVKSDRIFPKFTVSYILLNEDWMKTFSFLRFVRTFLPLSLLCFWLINFIRGSFFWSHVLMTYVKRHVLYSVCYENSYTIVTYNN